MAALIGVELSPGICRFVDVDVRRTKAGLVPTHVRKCSVLQYGSAEMTAALAGLRGRSAAVVVWGAPSDHRQVMVTNGPYPAMRREASRALALAGVETRGALVDIARVPSRGDSGAARSPVVVALASGAAVKAAVQPLQTAGLVIKVIATPATALASLARIRRQLATASAVPTADDDTRSVRVDGYVAIEESATCIALFRDGTLAAARELSWGFLERRRDLRLREDIATRFVDELSEFLINVGGSIGSLRQLTLCGGAPDLRSLAAELTALLDLEVEPLDRPFALDEQSDLDALERCAEMWVPWAAAVDQQTPLSLLHSRQLQAAQARFARVAVAAGIVVGVGVAWQATRCALRSAPITQPHRAVDARPLKRMP